RGERFKDHPHSLKGNNDLLSITRPAVIAAIHREYLEAGADIIETNTFSSNSIAQADYGLQDICYELNLEAARLARSVADEITAKDPAKPRFVAGAIGPTNKVASMSPDVNNPGYRAITFDEREAAFTEPAPRAHAGRDDGLPGETINDTPKAKAAWDAIQSPFEEQGKEHPTMVSGTITDASGRTLSGQTTEAILVSVSHVP